MPSKNLTANYSPAKRAVPSLAASFSTLSDQIHALHNDVTMGTDQQNYAVRTAMLEAFRVVGGEDAALAGNKLASAGFSSSATALTLYVSLT